MLLWPLGFVGGTEHRDIDIISPASLRHTPHQRLYAGQLVSFYLLPRYRLSLRQLREPAKLQLQRDSSGIHEAAAISISCNRATASIGCLHQQVQRGLKSLLEYVASFGTHVAAVGHCTSDPSSSAFRRHRLYLEIRDVRTSTTSRPRHCIGVLTTSDLYARDSLDQPLTAVHSSAGLNQSQTGLLMCPIWIASLAGCLNAGL